MIKVSIIVPVYNSDKYLKKCLDSIQNQTYKNYEAIIINDGSTDNSSKIIQEYINDERFKIINQNNHGIGYSRNLGIKKAQGDYICFVDSDDYIELNFLETMLAKIENDNLDIVVCDYIENHSDNFQKTIKVCEFQNTTIDDSPDLLININKAPWNKIYKKEIISNIKFPEKLKYEDTQFICEALKDAKIGKNNEFLYHYVIHNESETTTMDEKVFDIIYIVKNIRNIYKTKTQLKNTIDMLTIQILTTYTIQQRYQKNKFIREQFINEVFDFLKNNIPDYKKNIYFKERGLRGIIEKNKSITLIYCNIYSKLKKM